MLSSNEQETLTAYKSINVEKKVASRFKTLKCYIYLLISVKMPTIVGILTFITRIIFMLS